MFINEGALKKQIKKAYKTGWLTVADKFGMLYIAGLTWAMIVDKEAVTNKTKAALIELIGEIPTGGDAYKYSETEAQQVFSESLRDLDLDTYVETEGQTYRETRVTVQSSDGEGLYIQGDDLSHHIVSKEVYAMFDQGAVNKDLGELMPEPAKMRDDYLIWGNNVMALMIFAKDNPKWEGEYDFIKAVQGIDLCWLFTEK